MADSISFEPLKTPRIFPNKNTSFLIIFSPKSVHVRTTLEYFTIFSINNQTEMIYDVSDKHIDEIVQKVTICVRGSCYGNQILNIILCNIINCYHYQSFVNNLKINSFCIIYSSIKYSVILVYNNI